MASIPFPLPFFPSLFPSLPLFLLSPRSSLPFPPSSLYPPSSLPFPAPLGAWGSAVSSPSEVWGRAPAKIDFGTFQPLNLTSGGSNFNDFPENQLPKFQQIGMAAAIHVGLPAIPLPALLYIAGRLPEVVVSRRQPEILSAFAVARRPTSCHR